MDGKQGVLDMGGERDEEHVIVEGLVFKVKLLLQMCVCVCVRKAHRPPSVLCAFRGAACHFKYTKGVVLFISIGDVHQISLHHCLNP